MPSLNPRGGNLTHQEAKHLLSRTMFGPKKEEIDAFTGTNIGTAVDSLLIPQVTPPLPPIDPTTGADWVSPKPIENVNSDDNDLINHLMAWWCELIRTSGTNITERMVHFYHTHFTCKKSKANSPTALYYQLALFRFYALGNFKTLTKKVSVDNAMLVFLDGRLNESGFPNENYGRELLELYSIGKGPQIGPDDYTNYTETDIQEAARVLSGFNRDEEFTNIDPDTNLARGIVKTTSTISPQNGADQATRHDPDPKNFTGTLGAGGTTITPNAMNGAFATIDATYQELDDLVEMIYANDEAARFICRELYRYFVYYDITTDIENDIIIPLAQELVNNNYDVIPVLSMLLKSEHFYDSDNGDLVDDTKGAIIKSPLEVMMSFLRFFDVDFAGASTEELLYNTTYGEGLLGMLDDMGIDLYEPFEVAGYSAYHQEPEFNRHWITPTNLGRRYEFVDLITLGQNKNGDGILIQFDVMDWIENSGHIIDPKDADEIVTLLVDYLFPEIIRQDRYDYFRDRVLLDNLSIINWGFEWDAYISSGDDTNVRGQLEALVREIVQTPEFQLF